jgi:hypothetical protein
MEKIISSVVKPIRSSVSASSSSKVDRSNQEDDALVIVDNDSDDDASVSLSSLSFGKMGDLSQALQEGLEIKDRKWYGKTYRNCFLHADAVTWMMQKLSCNEATAVDRLNDLRLAGYVQHVVDPHKPFKVKHNKTLYFCFLEDQKSHANLFPSKQSKHSNSTVITPKHFHQLWKKSDDKFVYDTKIRRMESSLIQLQQAQMATQTKLEIVHQATISLIQATISTAVFLLILLLYTLLMVVPTMHKEEPTVEETSIVSGTFVFLTVFLVLFVAKFSSLFSVFVTMNDDSFVVEDSDDLSLISSISTGGSRSSGSPARKRQREPLSESKRGAMKQRRSTVLLEPLLRATPRSISIRSGHGKESDKEIRQRSAEELPPPSEWPNRPVLLCVNTPTDPSLQVEYEHGPCPIGKPFWFSSDLFEGYLLVRIRDVAISDDPESDMAYFDGRRRLFQTIVQGRFKESLPVSSVLTGHEFVKPLKNLPHQWILKAATNLIGKLSPGSDIMVHGDHPTMLAPLAGTSQVVRADEPGAEPDIASEEGVEEDCSLLGGKFLDGTVSSSSRKNHLANPKKASKYTFDTETVYTFDFYQNLLNVNTYSLELGIASISMCPILNGQPIQCLAKTTDGRYIWNFQIWHESLLPRHSNEDSLEKKKQ